MEIERLFDILDNQLENYNQDISLAEKVNGKWIHYSTQDFVDKTNQVSLGLLALGIRAGDNVAVISNNRPQWNFVDMGMLQIGVVNVPLYPNITEADYNFIFKDARIKLAFVSDEEIYGKIKSFSENIESLQAIYTFNEVSGAKSWTEVIDAGIDVDMNEVKKLKEGIKGPDLATIIYTSGTTGDPKGVMLSHANIVSNVNHCIPLLPVGPEHSALSFLPLNHSFERMLTYLYMSQGISIYYAENMETIGDNLKEIHPHIFATVPRLLEKVYDKIMAKGYELSGVKKKLFFWALNLGLKYEYSGKNGAWYGFKLAIANKIIFNKWREALGGNLRALVSGGAALQPRLARVFCAGKIPVMEGYGLTETSPVLAVNQVEEVNKCFGTVGPVLEGVELKIAESDGEIICKGPNIMMGYYNRQDLTDEVIDSDGWFHTGDIGEFVEGRFLKITDRKKELFKTSTGKYVAPQPIENKFKESMLIEQIMVVGEYQKFVGALIVPSQLALEEWCKENGINNGSFEDMVKEQKVIDEFTRITEEFNENFEHSLQIKQFRLIPAEWSIDTGEMTPTLKLKRKNVMKKYGHLVDEIYAE
ncbi:MAG: long-chain fatty acid--CoA ligase [Bacteroidetes bacterium]|nr:long-chain fatty acid--CoA ligase [Bacteroidota bacterium]